VSILVDAGLNGCEESQWGIRDSRLTVWEGNQSALWPVCAAIIHDTSEGLGWVGVEMLFSFDMGTHSGAEFNVHAGLEDSLLSLGACGDGPGGFLGTQINQLTCANGLGNVVATVVILLDAGCCFLMDGSMRGTVGGGCVHTKFHEWFLLGWSRCLLGTGALVALAFAAVEAAVASSTSARTSWCLIVTHGSEPFGCQIGTPISHCRAHCCHNWDSNWVRNAWGK